MTTLPPTLNDVPSGLPNDCFAGSWQHKPTPENRTRWQRLFFVVGGPTGKPTVFLAVSKDGLPEHVEKDVADAVKEAERLGYKVATKREWREVHAPGPSVAA